MVPYNTSRDMHHLKELLDKGYEVVCFYTHDAFGVKEESHTPYMVTDVCIARYIEDDEFSKYLIGCRGSVFIEYWTENFPYKYTFEELLAARDIQFIEPTILNEKDALELVAEKKKKDLQRECCGHCRYFQSDECINPKMLKVAKDEGWEYLQVDFNDNACGEFRKGKHKNPKTHFELKTLSKRTLNNEYQWCLDNLPLKEDRGIIYQVDEIYIITSSQKILDKVNKHFGSEFKFDNNSSSRYYFIN